MRNKKDIFNFNHIDSTIKKEKLSELRAFWSYKRACKYFKRLNLVINVCSTVLVAAGTIASGVTLNPIILGTILGAGLLLKTFSEIKDYKKKIEMSKFAFTTHEKVLVNLWVSIR